MKPLEFKKTRTLNINLQAQEVFCEVVRRQSFSRAGSSLGISQSAVSQLIAHLEDELECKLIDRQRRPLKLTTEGEIYYQGCQELLHRHRGLLDDIRRHQTGIAGTVRVSSIYSVGLHTLRGYIRTFMANFRGASVHLEYFHPSRVYSAVLNEEADLGVISYPKGNRYVQVIPWLEEKMVLACPPDQRLASRESVDLKELQGAKFVAFDRELKIRQQLDRALSQHHVQVDVISEFDNIETIKQALEISEAASILPRSTIRREVERGTLVEVSIRDAELVRPVGIICKRKRKLTSAAKLFIETLLQK